MKYFLLLIFSIYSFACPPKDASYFNINPKALQHAIELCPNESPKLVTCDELKNIAMNTNDLVYELRINPQEYGKNILKLQEELAKLKEIDHDNNVKLIKQKQLELNKRLSIVGWLESPVS